MNRQRSTARTAATGVTTSMTTAMTTRTATGVTTSTATGTAATVVTGVTTSTATGMAARMATGVTTSIATGIATRVATGTASRVATVVATAGAAVLTVGLCLGLAVSGLAAVAGAAGTAVAAAAPSAAGTATGAATGSKTKITHLTFYWHGQEFTDWLEWAAKEFEKENPGIDIDIMTTGGPQQTEYFTKLTSMLAAGTPPNVIDYIDLNLDPKLFVDLRPYLGLAPPVSLDQFPAGVLPWISGPSGEILALPWDIYPVVAYFNQDLLDERGLLDPYRLGSKWNWESLISNSLKLTQDLTGDGFPEAYGLDRMWAYVDLAIWNAGGQRYDRFVNPTRAQFNTPEVIKGLQWIQDVHCKWQVTPPGLAAIQTRYAFWLGTVGYALVDGPGGMQRLMNVKFRWDIALQPAGPARAGGGMFVDQFRILRAASHTAEAVRWVKFLSTRQEVVERLVTMTGRVPALSGLDYLKLNPAAPRHAQVFMLQAMRPDNLPPYIVPRSADIDKATAEIWDNVLLGKIEVGVAVQMLDDVINAILRRK